LFTLIAVSKLHSPYCVLILLPFTVSFLRKVIILISLEKKIEHIDSPVAFLKNFIYAQIYHFHMRAYSMLAPWTRIPGKVKPPKLQHMPVEYDMDEITGPESLGDYWASFLLPGDEAYRIPRIRTIDLISENPKLEIALVQVKINVRYTLGDGNLKRIAKFIRHLSTVFRGHTEQIILTKLLIRRLDRWFIAEAEADGELDHLPAQLLPML
ncbi:MAG: hypothetical protein D6820_15855, partial [Lentisphaerae bacterium]